MRDIRMTCYHGSGHGFMLAEAETMPRSAWGDLFAFTEQPLQKCEALEDADEVDVEQCKEGVFNVAVEWMTRNDFGFAYDTESPFSPCTLFDQSMQKACYYEMAMKLDSISGFDPATMAVIVERIPNKILAEISYEVGIAGIVQQTIAQGNGYEKVLAGCENLEHSLFLLCVRSIVNGLFEHGAPQREYEKSLAFCKDPIITAKGVESVCYERILLRLPRFYAPEKIARICDEFPPAYQKACAAGDINS